MRSRDRGIATKRPQDTPIGQARARQGGDRAPESETCSDRTDGESKGHRYTGMRTPSGGSESPLREGPEGAATAPTDPRRPSSGQEGLIKAGVTRPETLINSGQRGHIQHRQYYMYTVVCLNNQAAIEPEGRVDPHQGGGHPGDTPLRSQDPNWRPMDGFLTESERVLVWTCGPSPFAPKAALRTSRRATRLASTRVGPPPSPELPPHVDTLVCM